MFYHLLCGDCKYCDLAWNFTLTYNVFKIVWNLPTHTLWTCWLSLDPYLINFSQSENKLTRSRKSAGKRGWYIMQLFVFSTIHVKKKSIKLQGIYIIYHLSCRRILSLFSLVCFDCSYILFSKLLTCHLWYKLLEHHEHHHIDSFGNVIYEVIFYVIYCYLPALIWDFVPAWKQEWCYIENCESKLGH